MTRFAWIMAVWLALGAASAAEPARAAGERVALLIGNAGYRFTPQLDNPHNDVAAMAERLGALGFQTTVLRDLEEDALEEALFAFTSAAGSADTAVIFYSGHGMEIRGENFLIPIDARRAARSQAVPLQEAIDAVSGAARLSVLIIDACRVNTLPSQERAVKGFRPVRAGAGQVIAFSTAPGTVAYDGAGALSPYTQALTEALERSPDVDIVRLLRSLGPATARYAGDLGPPQEPWLRVGGMPIGEVTLSGRSPAPAPSEAEAGRLTIPPALTAFQVVERLTAEPGLSGRVRGIPEEGRLAPGVYDYRPGDGRAALIERMKRRQSAALDAAWAGRARDLPVDSADELLVLASIVQAESAAAPEAMLGKIAAVLANRLRRGMRLQSDPTVVFGQTGGYAFDLEGRSIDDFALRRRDLVEAGAYNTYRIDGLPPGPISNPGPAALEAAARPARIEALYFVSDGAGGYAFAETLQGHQRNVARWRARRASDPRAGQAGQGR